MVPVKHMFTYSSSPTHYFSYGGNNWERRWLGLTLIPVAEN
jgi:hypothetical protein